MNGGSSIRIRQFLSQMFAVGSDNIVIITQLLSLYVTMQCCIKNAVLKFGFWRLL